MQDVHIWNPETGITGLPEDLFRLEVPEMRDIEREWGVVRGQLSTEGNLEQFTEELHRRWAIETGEIENLYDITRGMTETLIEEGFMASVMERDPGAVSKDPHYVASLLADQKDALEGLFEFIKSNEPLTVGYIRAAHQALTKSQPSYEARMPDGTTTQLQLDHGQYKQRPNSPQRDGKKYLYCPPAHTSEQMEELVRLYKMISARATSPEILAAWIHHRFTVIHPFQDGNGRVARLLASLVLVKAGLFPFVVPKSERSVYFQALEYADQGNLRPLVLVIVRRQEADLGRAKALRLRLLPPANDIAEALHRLSQKPLVDDKVRAQKLSDLADLALRTVLVRVPSLLQENGPSIPAGFQITQALRLLSPLEQRVVENACGPVNWETNSGGFGGGERYLHVRVQAFQSTVSTASNLVFVVVQNPTAVAGDVVVISFGSSDPLIQLYGTQPLSLRDLPKNIEENLNRLSQVSLLRFLDALSRDS